ncbi:MAG: BatA domain-containing protein [Lentisphaeria bacterium]|jgi:hypothetical protein
MLTFAYPWFLWGLLVLAGPLILHLLNRRQPRRLVFPSIRFLRRSQLPREGRRRLRDLLLLLLRLLMLAAAVLLLARPRWQVKQEAAPDNAERRAVFLLDSSASMGGWDKLTRGKELVAEALKDLSGWQVSYVSYAQDVLREEPLAPAPGAQAAAMPAWSATALPGNPEPALRRAVAMLAGASAARLFIVSDFQQGDWARAHDLVPAAVSLQMLDVGRDGVENAGVTMVRCVELPNGSRRFLVTVRNFSNVSLQRSLTVRVGQERQTKELELPPLRSQRVPVVFSVAPDGSQAVAELDADGYELDDRYQFWVGRTPPAKALIVLPPEDSVDNRLDDFFVRQAMLAEQDDGLARFEVETVTNDLLFGVDFKAVQVIFLLGAAEMLAPDDLDQLRAFLERGGVAMVTPGRSPAIAMRSLRQASLYSGQLQGMISGEGLGIGNVDPDSVLGELFSAGDESDLYTFVIFRHHRLVPDPLAQTVISSLAGQPLLQEKIVGAGRLYVFALGFSPSWSDIALSNSFLPLLRELCLSAVPSDYGVLRLSCGDALPQLTTLLGEAIVSSRPIDTSVPGLHRLGDWPLEINAPTRESMTERRYAADVRLALQRDSALGGGGDAWSAALPATQSLELWRWLAVVMAAVMLAELLLRTALKV